MLLTFPFVGSLLLGTTFFIHSGLLSQLFLAWIGFSIGFHAFPSNTDIKGLSQMAKTIPSKIFLRIFSGIVRLFNIEIIGLFLSMMFATFISFILPGIFGCR